MITRTVTENTTTQGSSTTQKTSYNYLYNGHGDVTALLTQDGTIAASYYYDAFGTALETHYYNALGEETDKTVNNPYRYAGYVFDSTTDLYYLNARYYDSKIARFMSKDTYTGEVNDPLSLNLYTYCANNPVTYFDPTGHWMQGDENLNDEAKAKIIAIGNAWNNAKTKEEKDAIHAQAEAVRKENGAYDTNKDTLVEIKNVDAFDKAMIAAMADGKITKDEDANAQKLISATVTTSRTTSTQNDFKITTYDCTTTIGKSDVKVEAKTVQSTKNTNIVSTGANIDITTHYSAYVFYLPEFRSDMKDDIKRLAAYYGISENDIGTASISSKKELSNYWNSMGKNDKISTVIINTHANPNAIGFDESASNNMSTSDIKQLEDKHIKNLILYGCNAGHYDYKDVNVASIFTEKVNGGKVLAGDGTVYAYRWGLAIAGSYAYRPSNDETFRKYRKSERGNMGWLLYKNNKGKVSASPLYNETYYQSNKELTLTKILDGMNMK